MDDDAVMDPWERLGIDEDADVVSIRRAYAARIKAVRPDTDPVGFQRLVEARDLMLSWAPSALRAVQPASASAPMDTADKATAVSEPSQVSIDDPISSGAGDPTPGVPVESVIVLVDATPASTSLPAPSEPVIALESGSEQQVSDGAAGLAVTPAPTDPFDLIEMLRAGRTGAHPISPRGFELMLAGVSVGGGRWYESDVIEALSEAVTALEAEEHPDAVVTAYEHAACLLAEHFAWEERDRSIHETLERQDARQLLVFLGRAHRRHVPGYNGRFYRLESAATTPSGVAEPTGRSSWFSWRALFFWWLAISALTNLSRCAQS